MAVVEITTPPILISSIALQYFTGGGNIFVGPWNASGALYCVLGEPVGGVVLHVYKSTDGGATWLPQDDGNAITIFAGGQQSVFIASTIYLFCKTLDGGGGFASDFWDCYPFDIGSDNYGTLVAVHEPLPAVSLSGTHSQIRSTGAVVDLSNVSAYFAGSGVVVIGRIFSGGSYGSSFLVDSETSGGGSDSVVAREQTIDSNDVSHVLTLFRNFDLSVQETRYVTIDAGNSVSGFVTIDSDPGNAGLCERSIAFADNLAFPFYNDGGGFNRAKIFYATGATSNPASASWSVINVWTTGLDSSSVDVALFSILDTNGDLLVFWINTPPGGTFTVYYARFNGSSFDAPVVFYDPLLYPPAGSTQDATFGFGGLSIAIVGGQFVGIIAMNIDGVGDQTFYLTNGGTPALTGFFHSMY